MNNNSFMANVKLLASTDNELTVGEPTPVVVIAGQVYPVEDLVQLAREFLRERASCGALRAKLEEIRKLC